MRIYGRELSHLKELPEDYLRKTGQNFLIGEGGNFIVYKTFRDVYEGKLWRSRIYLKMSDFNKNTLVLGAMGTGKSNLLKYLSKVFELWGIRQFIHDVKGEYVQSFYEEGRDLIFNIFDVRGFFWDFVSDFKSDYNLMYTCLKSMIMSYLVDVKDMFWVEKGVEVLVDVFNRLSFSGVVDREDALRVYEELKEIFSRISEEARGETMTSAVGVASPCMKVLLDALFIYGRTEGERANLSLSDLYEGNFRRVYLVFLPEFSEKCKILNTGLLSGLILKYLSREDVVDEKQYVAFILDEYLSFTFPKELELQLFTLARSKGLCLITAMQYLPSDEERRKILTNSRFYTFAFRVADLETAKWLASITGEIEIDFDTVQFSDPMGVGMNPLQGGGVNTSYSRVKTFNVPYDVFLGLEKFTAFLSVEDRYRFFIRPVYFDVEEKKTQGFIRDEVTYQIPE